MILRDSITLLVLVLATAALYLVTTFLFRSFAARRAELAKHFAASGRVALQAGRSEAAISDLRVSLSYDPDNSGNRLLFAEALAQAHHSEEATNYFLGLRDTEPANGFINLQLARLAREKRDVSSAIEYYRASSLGNWTGDALTERRKVQLEFAEYLVQVHDLRAARSEILIAATNAPETADLDELFGDEFLKADDPVAALTFYRRSIRLNPHRFSALYKAGSTAYRMTQYADASNLLAQAVKAIPSSERNSSSAAEAKALSQTSQRIVSLSLSPNLAGRERVEHLQAALPIAKARLDACSAHLSSAGSSMPSLQSLQALWQSAPRLSRGIRADDTSAQDELTYLIFETEIQTAKICGTPTGDDALLLLLAQSEFAK